MKFARNRKEDPEINLIPMIDVLLVIIIFLMLTTTYSKFSELQINLPRADAQKRLERSSEINVVIAPAGNTCCSAGRSSSAMSRASPKSCVSQAPA